VEQLEGFVLHSMDSHVCNLIKSMHDIKQAPIVWYEIIDGFLKGLGFPKIQVDDNLYSKVSRNHPIILVLYVDELFVTRDEGQIAWCKRDLILEFEMKYLWLMNYFLGLEVWKK